MITSFRHDRDRVEKRRKILGTLLLLSLVIFVARGPLSNALAGILVSIGRPFWSLSSSIAEKKDGLMTAFTSKQKLEDENERLRNMLDAVSLEAYSRDTLRAENDELKSQLGRTAERPLVLARVLANPSTSPFDTLIIDTGLSLGVTPGMAVFVDGDFKIGEVTRVWKESALVTLYSSPDNDLPVTIGTSSIPATAHGEGGGNFRVLLPKGTDIMIGDMVDIPALAPAYAGKVEAITRPEGTSLQTIYVKVPFNIFELKWVYVEFPPAGKELNTKKIP